eukprot:TRINITY_DN57313_c0_g1_i1.p1 TRINITY_DN57313_c0_g1~~TRINITY_DN57313_c0_g1_i1.p1  ORF type:complete len:297 (-),score=32.95 TRINITY_DN57313_c0_g1_i1:236-1126(-)
MEQKSWFVKTASFGTAFILGVTSGICCFFTNTLLLWIGRHVLHRIRVERLRQVRPKDTFFLGPESDDLDITLERIRDRTCTICLGELLDKEETSEPADLLEPPCGHTLHTGCLRKWLCSAQLNTSGASACPVCRGPANVSDCVQILILSRCFHIDGVEASIDDAELQCAAPALETEPSSRSAPALLTPEQLSWALSSSGDTSCVVSGRFAWIEPRGVRIRDPPLPFGTTTAAAATPATSAPATAVNVEPQVAPSMSSVGTWARAGNLMVSHEGCTSQSSDYSFSGVLPTLPGTVIP